MIIESTIPTTGIHFPHVSKIQRSSLTVFAEKFRCSSVFKVASAGHLKLFFKSAVRKSATEFQFS